MKKNECIARCTAEFLWSVNDATVLILFQESEYQVNEAKYLDYVRILLMQELRIFLLAQK